MLRDAGEQWVTAGASERVVDLAEAVEIDKRNATTPERRLANASPSCSSITRWLGSPVSGSWVVSLRTSSALRLSERSTCRAARNAINVHTPRIAPTDASKPHSRSIAAINP